MAASTMSTITSPPPRVASKARAIPPAATAPTMI
jgi:hypothetical protein